MHEYSRDEILAVFREVVEERGCDFVAPLYFTPYPGERSPLNDGVDELREDSTSQCRYVNPAGDPECLVGTILSKLGVPVEALSGQEGRGATTALKFLAASDHIRLEFGARSALAELQNAQDDGIPWGFILDEYDRCGILAEVASRWHEIRSSKTV